MKAPFMLSTLTIQGLAIIESLSIEFDDGFNVITGETGAGKSILIRALHFLTGGRAGADSVRQGNTQATVSGTFHVPSNHPAVAKLDRLGLAYEVDGQVSIVLRRQMSSKGRSQAWINDAAVSTSSLREVGVHLVDVFGQHENQRLLNESSHIRYLDAFLEKPMVLEVYRQAWEKLRAGVRELTEFSERLESASRNRDVVEYRLKELKDFEPSREDFEALDSLCRGFQNASAITQNLSAALNALEGQDDAPGVGRSLLEAIRHLAAARGELADELAPLRERLEGCAREVEETSFELSQRLGRFEFDEADVDRAQARLFEYQDLFRKHGARTIDALIEAADRLTQEWESVASASESIADLLSTIENALTETSKASRALSAEREKASGKIRGVVEGELQQLAMIGSRFSVVLEPAARDAELPDLSGFGEEFTVRLAEISERLGGLGEDGAETARFLLSSNPGEPLMPLERIASGGELSRIMLALKKALAADADTCVLVFDEIDTGISGRVADIVGRKMKDLSHRFQVLCISHLPQVAVFADVHFLVHKEGKGERTESGIRRLSDEQSAVEIARLLSGSQVSASSLANARALISKARRKPRADRPEVTG